MRRIEYVGDASSLLAKSFDKKLPRLGEIVQDPLASSETNAPLIVVGVSCPPSLYQGCAYYVAASEEALPDYFKWVEQNRPTSLLDYTFSINDFAGMIEAQHLPQGKVCHVLHPELDDDIVMTGKDYDFGLPVEHQTALKGCAALHGLYTIDSISHAIDGHFLGVKEGKPSVMTTLHRPASLTHRELMLLPLETLIAVEPPARRHEQQRKTPCKTPAFR